MMLHNQNGITYYRQIADILITRIYNGIYQPGDQIPTGRELVKEFGCNRHTIRRALDILEIQELIVRKQGRGTFVVEVLPSNSPKTQLAIGLIDISHALGFRPQAEVLSVSVQPADEVASHLNINKSEKVTYIRRVRIINKRPAIVELIYIPIKIAPNLIKCDLSQSLRHTLKETYQLQTNRHEVIFEPILSSGYVSEFLEIPVGSALMLEKRTAYTKDNTITEYSEHMYRGDQFSFVMK